MSANKVYKLTLSNNNIDATSSSRVIGVIFVRLYQVSSACAVRFSVSGDKKAVLTVAILWQSLPPQIVTDGCQRRRKNAIKI